MEFCYVYQAGLELLASRVLASQSAGITGVSHRIGPSLHFESRLPLHSRVYVGAWAQWLLVTLGVLFRPPDWLCSHPPWQLPSTCSSPQAHRAVAPSAGDLAWSGAETVKAHQVWRVPQLPFLPLANGSIFTHS